MAAKPIVKPLGIADLLKIKGFPMEEPAKLVRHQDRRYDVNDMIYRGWFEFYQATQGKPRFQGCKRIISFVGAGGTKARFVGVYNVLTECDGRDIRSPRGYPEVLSHYRYFYELERDAAYDDLRDRLIVEWGKGAINWHQWFNRKRLNDKVIVEFLSSGQTLPEFRDYLEFTLTYHQLKELVQHDRANGAWRSRLAAVAGVYLVLATTTGQQYIGSAYGAKGIWGRWMNYAQNGHGGNKMLKKLIKNDPAYPDAFSYSILQILPNSLERDEVLRRESQFKKKLGSCAFGLNTS
jgi:hypothetical protein